MTRRVYVLGVVMVAALTGSGAPHAQTPATNQRVWTGTWEEHDSWAGRNKFGRSQAQISFVYVQGQDEFGVPRWESRRLTWSAMWEQSIFDHLVIEKVGAADERGLIQNRYPMDIVTSCAGGGTLELGPAGAGAGNDLTPEQKAQLRLPSVTTYRPRDSSIPAPAPTTGTCDGLLQVPGMPNDDELTGCAYEKSWPKGGRPAGSFSVSVSAPVTAVLEADPKGEYGRFVPAPGDTLTFVARVPSGEARFRFELDPEATSHFPGYATNADVDDAFFVKYNLGHLRGRYANDGPDMIFDKEHFRGQEWSRIEPLVVETRAAQGAAVVTVTAMDYGAIGRLRAFVKSEDCGDWMPVPVRVGTETREAIAIPMDEDNNLMADALEWYRGRDAGADDDAEPKGNGLDGDGLTAFEEYRGFMVRGAACDGDVTVSGASTAGEATPGWSDEHIRSAPHHKNLFIHTPDPELVVMLENFAWSSGISVHPICESHYADNERRIVNFTLQDAGLRTWNGRTVSQAESQHGLWVKPVEELEEELLGIARPVDANLMGPPKLTKVIDILKPAPSAPAEGVDPLVARYVAGHGVNPKLLDWTLRHELGHAVGIPHHSDTVEDWRIVWGKLNVTTQLSPLQGEGGPPEFSLGPVPPPDSLLVMPGPGCTEEDWESRVYEDGRFAGCLTQKIVRRGQQNSGDHVCPMRYRGDSSDYYEAPGETTRFEGNKEVVEQTSGGSELERYYVDVWSGKLLPYQQSLELGWLGQFCASVTGTGINELPGDLNHAGNAGRDEPCSRYVVVNDVAARGLP